MQRKAQAQNLIRSANRAAPPLVEQLANLPSNRYYLYRFVAFAQRMGEPVPHPAT